MKSLQIVLSCLDKTDRNLQDFFQKVLKNEKNTEIYLLILEIYCLNLEVFPLISLV
jgi:hypothetical protein